MKHTKIVATLGPASSNKDIQRAMIKSGANVFRLNFSHGEHAWHRQMINQIRELSEELVLPIAILGDLQGPRIRTEVNFPIDLKKDFMVKVSDLSHRKAFSAEDQIVYIDTPGILENLQEGHRLLIEDGLMQVVVTKVHKGFVDAQAKNDGTIKNRKGIILPDTPITLPILSDKDKADLQFMIDEGVNYIGLSFVGSAQDVETVRHMIEQYLDGKGKPPLLCSKIERDIAIKNLASIVTASDAVMVARGDLGIEMPESEVVILQKEIIAESLRQMRPVIVATQMMQSMVGNPRPTRAEVSDVSNAVIDHADAVMLSEESAAGKYPVETVATMCEIIEKTEESRFDDLYQALDLNLKNEYAVVIRSVYELAQSYKAKAILLLSMSGFTARLISHFRPDAALSVATNDKRTWQELALVWGIEATLFDGDKNLNTLMARFTDKLKGEGRLSSGDQVVVFSGRTP
ncbi:MAG: pyruvate kinase, partial [Candidatus Moraniibacteriota bacterium]